MRSLDQLEARVPISAPVTINNPGSYYLITNLTVVGFNGNGITINADNVTLDLNGFTISGDGSANSSGVQVVNPHHNLCVRNGTIRNIAAGDGIFAPKASGSRFERLLLYANDEGIETGTSASLVDCVVESNGFLGLQLDAGSVARDCIANMNGIGISTLDGCSVIDCTVVSNQYGGITCGYGCNIKGCTLTYNANSPNSPAISTTNGCTISDCSVFHNGGGIVAGQGCVITGCSVRGNFAPGGIICSDGSIVSACSTYANSGSGIRAQGSLVRDCNSWGNSDSGVFALGSTVSGCVVQNNSNDGISVFHGGFGTGTGCLIIGNNCQENNNSGAGYANIDVFTDNNRIENNFIMQGGTFSAIGLQAAGTTNNIIIKNSASGAGIGSYNPGPYNDFGPVGNAFSATSPWANIAH
jgi:hypothetical protein